MNKAPVLDVRLKHQFTGFDLDVSFILERHIGVLFGPSGAGKTVTMRLIAGLLSPDQGHIRLGNKVLFSQAPEAIRVPPQKRRIGYVFQHHALFPHMTVLENIVYGARELPREQAKQEAHKLLQEFRLDGLESKYPKSISGGQKQRVAFARALIAKPDLLLLDEPFSALDNPTRIHMRECLAVFMRSLNIPVLLVTHDSEEAITMADRMFLYMNGRIVQQGQPNEILSSPVSPEVENLLSDHRKLLR